MSVLARINAQHHRDMQDIIAAHEALLRVRAALPSRLNPGRTLDGIDDDLEAATRKLERAMDAMMETA